MGSHGTSVMHLDDIHPTTLDGLKSLARRLKKAEGLSQAEALDRAALQAGFSAYAQARRALEAAVPQGPFRVFVSSHWSNPTTGRRGDCVVEIELSAPLSEVMGRAPSTGVVAFEATAVLSSDHLRGTGVMASATVEAFVGAAAAVLREIDAGRPLVQNEFGFWVPADLSPYEGLTARRIPGPERFESPGERQGIVALSRTDIRPAAECLRQDSIEWEEQGATWLRPPTLLPRSVHRRIANLLSPLFDRLPGNRATPLYGALLNFTDNQAAWLRAEDRDLGLPTNPSALEPENDQPIVFARMAKYLRAAARQGASEIHMGVHPDYTLIQTRLNGEMLYLAELGVMDGADMVRKVLDAHATRATAQDPSAETGVLGVDCGFLPREIAQGRIDFSPFPSSPGRGAMIIRLDYLPEAEQSLEAEARRAMRGVRDLLGRHVPDCAARDRLMKLTREIEMVAAFEGEGRPEFPPEADSDFDVVPEERIAELRAEMERRYGIGQGRIREIDEPSP